MKIVESLLVEEDDLIDKTKKPSIENIKNECFESVLNHKIVIFNGSIIKNRHYATESGAHNVRVNRPRGAQRPEGPC